MRPCCLWLSAFLLFAPTAASPEPVSARDILASVEKFPPLVFDPAPREELGAMSRLSNAVFKPKGDGPFPAIVLVHTCGGIHDSHMRTHAADLLAQGFVVLMQDSFTPRGRRDCGQNYANRVPLFVGVNDAYGALKHLAQFPFVDKARIYQAGYSYGGFVATLLASPGVAETVGASARFRATIANYSTCKFMGRDLLLPGSDRPVLLLLGEKDDEAPPASCFPLLQELKAAGSPVAWHVFPGATHGWDKRGQARSGYFYNEETTREATRRMLEFIAQNP